ncbi:MAG: tail fiber protein [Thiotrichaceae bacterium]|nr:tail fiber protein [Thiotrichaceae bacterium]
MTEANLEQALEELKTTQDTLQAQQQEIEALKTKLLYLTETEIVKTRAELAANQKNLGDLTDTHSTTKRILDNVGNEVTQIQKHVQDTLEQEVTATKTLIQQTQKEAENLLVGAVMAFAMPEAPEGWFACNGEEISRTEYARLFERIGIVFGEGDGETTFNLPDLRGLFVRGWDNAGQIDLEREFATGQYDQIQTHNHEGITNSSGSHNHNLTCADSDDVEGVGKGAALIYAYWGVKKRDVEHHINYISDSGSHTHNLVIGEPTKFNSEYPRHGNETRPKNIALLYCIKY